MSRAIGIDFGSTKCCVAELSPAGAPRILQNGDNQDFTPAVVGCYKGELIVGRKALDRLGAAPAETVLSVRALLGREDAPRILLGGQERTPLELAARLLRQLKEDAEMRLREPAEYAVLTVPARFSERQRSGLRQAAQLAGLRVQHLLAEPVAAAMSLGLERAALTAPRRLLICDLGGEGFEASLVEFRGETCAVRHSEGGSGLGGDAFDHKLAAYVVEHIRRGHAVDPAGNARFMAELRRQAEKAKRDLSNQARTELAVLGLLKGRDGQPLDVEVPLEREQFERLIVEEMKRCLRLAQAAVAGAGLRPEEVDQVVLTGGSSNVPLFRRAVASVFPPEKILAAPEPMKSVACGAARVAAQLGPRWECAAGHVNPAEAEACAQCAAPPEPGPFYRVTPASFGLRLPGDRFEVVIPAGTRFPLERPVTRSLLTPQANLRRLRLPIYQGHCAKASENELQLILWVELPPQLPARTAVEVSFQLDGDGILEVTAALRDGSGRPVRIYCDRGDSARGRLEEKLYRARRAWDAQRIEAQKRFEAACERALEALEGADLPAAESALAQIARLLEALAGAGPRSE